VKGSQGTPDRFDKGDKGHEEREADEAKRPVEFRGNAVFHEF
jgi:hypothetical protein